MPLLVAAVTALVLAFPPKTPEPAFSGILQCGILALRTHVNIKLCQQIQRKTSKPYPVTAMFAFVLSAQKT